LEEGGTRMTRIPRFLALAVFGCLAAPVLGQGTAPAPPAGSTGEDLYLVGPGDVLQVFVWKEADLTREATVRSDGRISLPLLGDIQAAGRTPHQLADEIQTRLTRFIGAPVVSVGVSQPNSTRIFIVGQVARPGVFPFTGPTRILQLLALAGGFKEFANTSHLLVIRQEGEGQKTLSVDYKKIESGSDVNQNIVLKSGDTIVVP